MGVTKDLDFIAPALMGFGVSANATFSRAHYPVSLQNAAATTTLTLSAMLQQARQMWNTTLYYEANRVHARRAWSHLSRLWDDRYPNSTLAGFYANRYQQPTDNVDIKDEQDIYAQVIAEADAHGMARHVLVKSFVDDRTVDVAADRPMFAPVAYMAIVAPWSGGPQTQSPAQVVARQLAARHKPAGVELVFLPLRTIDRCASS